MINVTKTYLPDLSEYKEYLEKIWENAMLTNNGEFVKRLETEIKNFQKTESFFLVNNGTIALQIAIKALDLKGEIITTPFSYVATTSAILWENCEPVFVDIDSSTLNINADLIENSITEKTSAILVTHVYGNPCNVEKIAEIAKKYNLKVIYDAAHCFGVFYKNKSICSYGDISTLSFHATKLFHMAEGGGIVVNDPDIAEKVFLLRQFGHIYDDHYTLGINGKVSEIHAALGLCVLPAIKKIVEYRKSITKIYDDNLVFEDLRKPQIRNGTEYNYAYYPVVFKTEEKLKATLAILASNDIYPRRYFYPSLNSLPYLKNKQICPVSEQISASVLSLPLYYGLENEVVYKICKIINQSVC